MILLQGQSTVEILTFLPLGNILIYTALQYEFSIFIKKIWRLMTHWTSGIERVNLLLSDELL